MGVELSIAEFLYTNLASQTTAQETWVIITQVLPYLLFGLATLIICLKRKWKLLFFYFISLGIGIGLKEIISWVFIRTRPYVLLNIAIEQHLSDSSFYSLHTLIATISVLFLFFVIKENWQRIVLILLAIIVGLSRVVLAQHYVSDVLIAYLLAIILFLICKKWCEEKEVNSTEKIAFGRMTK